MKTNVPGLLMIVRVTASFALGVAITALIGTVIGVTVLTTWGGDKPIGYPGGVSIAVLSLAILLIAIAIERSYNLWSEHNKRLMLLENQVKLIQGELTRKK